MVCELYLSKALENISDDSLLPTEWGPRSVELCRILEFMSSPFLTSNHFPFTSFISAPDVQPTENLSPLPDCAMFLGTHTLSDRPCLPREFLLICQSPAHTDLTAFLCVFSSPFRSVFRIALIILHFKCVSFSRNGLWAFQGICHHFTHFSFYLKHPEEGMSTTSTHTVSAPKEWFKLNSVKGTVGDLDEQWWAFLESGRWGCK